MLEKFCDVEMSNPFARALGETNLNLAERKAKFSDCCRALSDALQNAIKLYKVEGTVAEVVELGAGLSLIPHHDDQKYKVSCVETHIGVAELARDISDASVYNLASMKPKNFQDCSVVIMNGWKPEILDAQPLRNLMMSPLRVILVEHINSFETSCHNSYLTSVQDRMAHLFTNSSVTLGRLRLLGHKPHDIVAQTAIVELEVAQ